MSSFPQSEYPTVELKPVINNRLIRIEIWCAVLGASVILGCLLVLSQKAKTVDTIESKIEQGLMDRSQLKGHLEVIQEQNTRSIQDRAYLHEELTNTRNALQRLETKLKTQE